MRLRYYTQADLPTILHCTTHNAWDQLAPLERTTADFHRVGQAARQMILSALQSPGGTALIAEENGELAGYMVISVSAHPYTGEKEAQFVDILVNPKYRRRRVGTRLTQAGEAYCRQLGCRRVRIWVGAHNEPSLRNAEHLGYLPEGQVFIKPLTDDAVLLPDADQLATDRLPWDQFSVGLARAWP